MPESIQIQEDQCGVTYSNFVENSTEALFVVQNECIRFFNPWALELAGYSHDELMNKSFIELFHLNDREMVMGWNHERSNNGFTDKGKAFRLVTKQGSIRWVEKNGVVLIWNKQPAYLIILNDVTERIMAEERLQASLNEKIVLLKEIHHRVKNNLQVICSLLNLQMERSIHADVIQSLRESRNRILSMAKIHESLYRSDDFTKVDLSQHITSLVGDLMRSYQGASDEVNLDITIDEIVLGIDKAIPCGLIINELLSNVLKHAFPPDWDREKRIEIKMTRQLEKEVSIMIHDSGVGLPKDFTIQNSESLGLYLVRLLVEDQLGGQLQTFNHEGTTYKIVFNEGR